MNIENRAGVPREQIIDDKKPWLRRLGGQVIRYVRSTIEMSDPDLVRLRYAGNPDKLRHGLEQKGQRLLGDCDLLRKLGVSVVPSTVEVCNIPYFTGRGEQDGNRLGLKITSQYVEGTPLPQHPIAKNLKLNGHWDRLRNYVCARREADEPFLFDPFKLGQYVVDETRDYVTAEDITLVDVDPIFAVASPITYNKALEVIDHFEAVSSNA